jgi:hypothetical protein
MLHVGTHIWRYGALHNASKQIITAPHKEARGRKPQISQMRCYHEGSHRQRQDKIEPCVARCDPMCLGCVARSVPESVL